MIEDPHDICRCGDYRQDHTNSLLSGELSLRNDGACIFGYSHGIPHDQPEARCERFRLSRAAVSVLDPHCSECEREATWTL